MQTKFFGGIFALLCGGLCFEAGRISQKDKKQDYTSTVVEIHHPEPKGLFEAKSLKAQNQTEVHDTFNVDLIQPPVRTVTYPNFRILYSTYHKCPLAVHQKVTKQLADGDAPRRSGFFAEKTIDLQFRSLDQHFTKAKAYNNFYLARGHMAAAGNYSGNKEAKFQTFTLANVVPQNQHNNSGIWNTFQRYTRDLVMTQKCSNIQVISGPIFFKNGEYQGQNGEKYPNVYKEQSMVLLENGMMVPEKLYKIIKCNAKDGQTYLDAFEFWNKKTFDNDKPLKAFKTSLESVENQTGLKFNFSKDVVGKPQLLKSLIEFDRQSFEKTKKVHDEPFYTNMISKARSIEDMNMSFMRAKEQQIFIPLDQFKQQTQRLFKQDLKQLDTFYMTDQVKTACQTLDKLMKLNKGLFYLRQVNEEYEEQIRKEEDKGALEQCYEKSSFLRMKKWEDLQGHDEQTANIKKEKSSLNSVTYAITKSLEKSEEIYKTKAAPKQEIKYKPLAYVNEQKLKKFIIPVNIAVSVTAKHQPQKETTKSETVDNPSQSKA